VTTCLLVLVGDKLTCISFFDSGNKRKSRVKLEDYDLGTQTLLKTNDGVLLNAKGLREPLNREQIEQLDGGFS